MAENVEGHRGRRRGRLLVLGVLLAIGVWVVRSQRAARADTDARWPLPPPADADRQLPTAAAPAESASRRPSPRPRPTSPSAPRGG